MYINKWCRFGGIYW